LVNGIVPLLIVLIGRFLYPTFYHHNQGNFISALIMMKTPVFVQVIYFGALISALLSTASGAILAPATVLAESDTKVPVKPIRGLLNATDSTFDPTI
jgi:Na+/pantothenate symporter